MLEWIYNNPYWVPPIIKKHNPILSQPIISFQPKIKYKYIDPDGRKLSAGGIIFFETIPNIGKGVWLLEEEEDRKKIYSDFGGKYDYNDGDIIATISREFREETYNIHEITYKDLLTVHESYYYYISGYDKTPTYLCFVIPIDMFNIKFDVKSIKSARDKIIKANQNIPSEWYKTIDVKFILLSELNKYELNNRTKAIFESILNNPKNGEIKEFFNDLIV